MEEGHAGGRRTDEEACHRKRPLRPSQMNAPGEGRSPLFPRTSAVAIVHSISQESIPLRDTRTSISSM